jgi:uncharacterized protein
MTERSVEVKVKGVALDSATQSPIVILQDESGEILLPVCTGPSEASAIIVELEDIRPTLPLTHDIVSELFNRHGFTFQFLEIYGYADCSYLSRIRYRRFFRSFSMEVRPSDGIALALRLHGPIMVDSGVQPPKYPFGDLVRGQEDVYYLHPEHAWPAYPLIDK